MIKDPRTLLFLRNNTTPSEMSITGKVSNIEAWKQLSNVRHGTSIKLNTNSYLVTGRVNSNDVLSLSDLDFVNDLQVARGMKLM